MVFAFCSICNVDPWTRSVWTEVRLLLSCIWLCKHMDCCLPGSSVHVIFQGRVLEWVAIFSSRGIFLTQGLNPNLLYLLRWQVDSLPLSHLGSPGPFKCRYFSIVNTTVLPCPQLVKSADAEEPGYGGLTLSFMWINLQVVQGLTWIIRYVAYSD